MPREARKAGDWTCYVCQTLNNRVVFLPEIQPRYFCTECLLTKVAEGTISVSDATTQAAVVSSVTLPVTTHDDGSITVGEVDIRWD